MLFSSCSQEWFCQKQADIQMQEMQCQVFFQNRQNAFASLALAGIRLAQTNTGTISSQAQTHQAMGSTATGPSAPKTDGAGRPKDRRGNRYDFLWQRIRHTRCPVSKIEKECAFP